MQYGCVSPKKHGRIVVVIFGKNSERQLIILLACSRQSALKGKERCCNSVYGSGIGCLRGKHCRKRMDAIDFYELARQCAPDIHPVTLRAIVRTESDFNPYAIGVVGHGLHHQPTTKEQAIAAAKFLEKNGSDFSVGICQVNKKNLDKLNLNYETAFDACSNLRGCASILRSCYRSARARFDDGDALDAAISCFYSGNFRGGFVREASGTSYVQRVNGNAVPQTWPATLVPAIPLVKRAAATHLPSSTDDIQDAPAGFGGFMPLSRGIERNHTFKWDAFSDFVGR